MKNILPGIYEKDKIDKHDLEHIIYNVALPVLKKEFGINKNTEKNFKGYKILKRENSAFIHEEDTIGFCENLSGRSIGEELTHFLVYNDISKKDTTEYIHEFFGMLGRFALHKNIKKIFKPDDLEHPLGEDLYKVSYVEDFIKGKKTNSFKKMPELFEYVEKFFIKFENINQEEYFNKILDELKTNDMIKVEKSVKSARTGIDNYINYCSDLISILDETNKGVNYYRKAVKTSAKVEYIKLEFEAMEKIQSTAEMLKQLLYYLKIKIKVNQSIAEVILDPICGYEKFMNNNGSKLEELKEMIREDRKKYKLPDDVKEMKEKMDTEFEEFVKDENYKKYKTDLKNFGKKRAEFYKLKQYRIDDPFDELAFHLITHKEGYDAALRAYKEIEEGKVTFRDIWKMSSEEIEDRFFDKSRLLK